MHHRRSLHFVAVMPSPGTCPMRPAILVPGVLWRRCCLMMAWGPRKHNVSLSVGFRLDGIFWLIKGWTTYRVHNPGWNSFRIRSTSVTCPRSKQGNLKLDLLIITTRSGQDDPPGCCDHNQPLTFLCGASCKETRELPGCLELATAVLGRRTVWSSRRQNNQITQF